MFLFVDNQQPPAAALTRRSPAFRQDPAIGTLPPMTPQGDLLTVADYAFDVIRKGDTEYPLHEQLWAEIRPTSGNALQFWVSQVCYHFVGQGETREAARNDWENQIHVAFQRLVAMRPFEMDANDKMQWRALQLIIDVPRYRRETPIRFREIGCVSEARPIPNKIEWLTGNKEVVSLDQMPAEFARYRPGQWFEATILRDPLSKRIKRVIDICPISEIHRMSDGERQRFWDSLPTLASTNNLESESDEDGEGSSG